MGVALPPWCRHDADSSIWRFDSSLVRFYLLHLLRWWWAECHIAFLFFSTLVGWGAWQWLGAWHLQSSTGSIHFGSSEELRPSVSVRLLGRWESPEIHMDRKIDGLVWSSPVYGLLVDLIEVAKLKFAIAAFEPIWWQWSHEYPVLKIGCSG